MATETETVPKLSSSKSIGFRPGALRKQLDDLYAELLKVDSGLKLSDIVRDGLIAFWPQIEAYSRAKQHTKIGAEELAAMVLDCAKAREFHVSAQEMREAIYHLIERKVSRPTGPVALDSVSV